MAQQLIKQMVEQMTAMYNNLKVEEKENNYPTKRRYNATKENKIQWTKEVHQSQCTQKAQLRKHCNQVSHHFEKYCFEIKENEERR